MIYNEQKNIAKITYNLKYIFKTFNKKLIK